jgi:hypothetical protein
LKYLERLNGGVLDLIPLYARTRAVLGYFLDPVALAASMMIKLAMPIVWAPRYSRSIWAVPQFGYNPRGSV